MDTSDIPEAPQGQGPTGPAIPPNPQAVLNVTAQRYLAQWWGPEDNQIECPICKTKHWTLLPVVDLPVRYETNQVITVVPVQCDTCRYVIFFNAISAGLFGPDGMPAPLPPTSDT